VFVSATWSMASIRSIGSTIRKRLFGLYQAMDKMKAKHGSSALVRAVTMDVSRRVRMDMNMFKG